MPLTVGGVRLDASPSDPRSLFSACPYLKERGLSFSSVPSKTVGPAGLLYVSQREIATTTPLDKNVTVLGSDDATTCHMLVMRHSGSGVVSLGHFDGSCTEEGLLNMIQSVQELSVGFPDGRLEIHVIGGFEDRRGCSHEVFINLMYGLHKIPFDLELVTACVGEVNTAVRDGVPWPIVYGIAVSVATGEICPANFQDKGPALSLRCSRTFTGVRQMPNIYDARLGLLRIGPFDYEPMRGVDLWLGQDDDFLRQHLSTSPEVEPPDFAAHVRATLKHIRKHPFPSITVFADNRPHLYRKDGAGLWVPVRL